MTRKIGQAEIAAAAGVSVSTVSRVLAGAPGISDRVRNSVRGVAENLGYPVALAPEPVPLTRAIAYLADGHGTSVAPAYQPVLEGLREAAQDAGIRLAIALRERSGELPGHIFDDPSVGTFLIGVDPSESAIDRIAAAGTPTVLVNGLDPDQQVDAVAPANFFGGRLVARHLAENGHRKLLHVVWRQRWTLRRRASGVASGAAEFSTPDAPLEIEVLDLPSLDEIDVFTALENRLSNGAIDFTAVVCSNDVGAICVLQALKARGIQVPEQISVVGFDDVPVAALSDPPLTTIRVDWKMLGHEAMHLMIQRSRYPERSAVQVQTKVQLVARDTVRRLS
ncbi:LacI family DNA-binding transcriptional regulator [Pseudoruegeria sp. HB172150]|uniref:LacI family DNA-binding transcriptional regulator n=1 Tax=Pseudoruegeria sp. HB172150 TaxID=2721164 RepID=UPI001556864B|nr:LacI family DNA-binding transcriptional regulator [Pseudoruegeria sp. HB172150]